MSAVTQSIKSRKRRNRRNSKNLSGLLARFSLAALILVGLSASILIVAGSYFYASILRDIPSPISLPTYFQSINQLYNPTKLYDRSGEHLIAILENPNAKGQKYLFLDAKRGDAVPPSVISATVASREPGFWSNSGISWDEIRYTNRPTIARLLSRQYLLNEEDVSVNGKIKEWLLATQVISLYGHDQVLEWYINSAYYGHLAYGIDAAAKVYFNKPATGLTFTEAAILAAAAKSPDQNPVDAPVTVRQEADRILELMHQQGFISSAELKKSLAEDVNTFYSSGYTFNLAPNFTTQVLEQVSGYIPEEEIFRGGMQIITTLDYELQTQAGCTAAAQIARAEGVSVENESSTVFKNCEMARLLPSIPASTISSKQPISANILIMDQHDGQVLTMVEDTQVDRESSPAGDHPPGTILTPMVYLTAFTRGSSPATLTWDIPTNFPSNLADLQGDVQNFNGPVSLRTALANDYLTPAMHILDQMGPEQVWHTAESLGLTQLQFPPGDGSYRVLVEGGRVNLAELSQAYGVFANQGVLAGIVQNNGHLQDPNPPIKPQVVLKVLDNSGSVRLDCTDQLSDCHPIQRPVTTQELAYLITDVLSDEVARWSSLGHPNSLEIGRPAAAKIGSANSDADHWTIGYTPHLLTAVWVGNGDLTGKEPIPPALAPGLWHAVMQYATKDLPGEDFPIPATLNEVQVCYPSGLIPNEDCPHTVDEIFIIGNEPTQVDNLFQSSLVNRESGRLATIFTPPALIDEETYMDVPPEAQEWALTAGIPQIPTAYDVLDVQFSQTGGAQINSPGMFNTISGLMPIVGRATGEGFQSYRLQFGPGLNPDKWFLIGEESDQLVEDGRLAIWNTSGLSGLYVLQLIVAYEDNQVETSTIQVTIDNQEPEVNIRFPKQGQNFQIEDYETISVQVEANDNLAIERVELYIDRDLVATLISPPYVFPWNSKAGEHLLRAVVYDLAGNKSATQLLISVE